MNIDFELDKLLIKYGVVQAISVDECMAQIKRKLLKYLNSSSKIGLYGCGIEADSLLYWIKRYLPEIKISKCFDGRVRTYSFQDMVLDTDVSMVNSDALDGIHCMIIGSYRYQSELVDELQKREYCGEIVNPYVFLEDYIKDHYTDYKEISELEMMLKQENNNRELILKQLIKKEIAARDFVNAFYYIDNYCSCDYEDAKKYRALENELIELLEIIKKTIKYRSGNDIIINWIDALPYCERESFPFLHWKAENGIDFSNAYTVIPWTTETTKVIMTGEYPIEGKLFLQEHLTSDNSCLLSELKNSGYTFVYCGMPRFAKKLDDDTVSKVELYENKYSGSMQKQWEALSELCKHKEPLCCLIHNLRETHEPYVGGRNNTSYWYGSRPSDWDQDSCRKQVNIAGKHLDTQLSFYNELYVDNVIEIYMSDHGREGNSPMNEKKIHILFSIYNKRYSKTHISKFFSLVRFPQVIKMIIENNQNWDMLTDDFVLIENLDAYSEELVSKTLNGEFLREETCQCRGIITDLDRYYLYASGKEYYWHNREDVGNDGNGGYNLERLENLRGLCGREFIDIHKYDKFKYSRRLYENV